MTVILTLGPSGDTINLVDGINYAVASQGIDIRPSRQRSVISTPGRDAVRLNASQASEIRITINLRVLAATDDALVASWRAVVDKLRKARLFALDGVGSQVELILKWNNATASVVYDVIDGDFPPAPGVGFPVPSQIENGQLALVCLPYARSAAAVSASSGTITNDTTGYTPTAPVGDAAIPLRLSLQNKQAAVTMNFIRAAVRSRGTPANFLFPIIPGANAPTGFTPTFIDGGGVSTGPVQSVTVTARARVPIGPAFSPLVAVNLGFRSGGTWYTVASSNFVGSAWGTVNTGGVQLDPRTGAHWVLADINSYEWGIRQNQTLTTIQLQINGKAGSVGRTVDLGFRTGGIWYTVGTVTLSTIYGTLSTTATGIDPRTGVAWTISDVNAYEWGARSGTLSADFVLITAFYVLAATTFGAINTLRSTADGAVMNWVATPAPAWAAIDDATPNGDTDYISTTTDAAIAVFVTEDFPVQVDVTQLYVTPTWIDRDLIVQTTDLLVTANGAVNDWTTTGQLEVNEWDAVNDPVGAPNDATDYISSSINLQVSVYATEDLNLNDKGVRLRPVANVECVRIAISSNLADHYGAFRVMVRAQGTAGDQLQLKWGGSTGALITNAAVALAQTSSTLIEIVDLGRMNIPEQEAPSDVSLASFVFSLWRGTGANALRIDTIELWPADEYVEFEPTTGPSTDQIAVIDSLARLPTAYLADLSGNRIQSLAHAGAAPRLQPSASRLLVRMSRSRTDDRRADSIAVAVKYYPRWEWQRGAV